MKRPHIGAANVGKRDWYLIAEQPAPAPHLAHPEECAAHPEGCDALRIVLVTVPRVSPSCENLPGGFDLHPLRCRGVQANATFLGSP